MARAPTHGELLRTVADLMKENQAERAEFQATVGRLEKRVDRLGSALAKQACQQRYRAHYIRMPDLEETWAAGRDKPGGKEKFLRKYAAFTLLVIDEWLLDQPDDNTRSMLLELLERRYDTTSTVFCTQYAKKDWHQRLGSGVHADAIMDRIVHHTIWIETGGTNMCEHAADNTA